MADRRPGLFARLLGPEAAAAMERESRAWLVICPDCGFSRSVRDMGGTRYKASGTILLAVAGLLLLVFKLTGLI
jgi:hypothetical protein